MTWMANTFYLREKYTLIGRYKPPADIPLNDVSVSRKHASIIRNKNNTFSITDLYSHSGTFVNNRRIYRPQYLNTGDIIQIGQFEFTYNPGRLEERGGGLGLEANGLRKEMRESRNLLQDISISIPSGKFVAIVGESGCGKSTLMKALNGIDPATDGQVSIIKYGKKYDLYDYYDSFRNQLGYVPQEDIIHRELTVYEALKYAAKLRMPDDITAKERNRRIEDVLQLLDMQGKKGQVIASLSGGERKRISIAVELLSSPSLLFLDEATSGLDPFHESQLMGLLKGLQQTIILVTHTTHDITACDSVAILAREHRRRFDKNNPALKKTQSGYLIYYGSPRAAPQYFNANTFDQIYSILANEDDRWKNWYKPQNTYRTDEKRRPPKPAQNRNSTFKQLITLIQRNINVLMRDRISLILMLLIAPIVGILSATFWRHGLFSPEGGAFGGDAELAITNLFMAAIICCITGSISSMREIVKEKDIYLRERMVALQIIPYVLSKTIVSIIIALYQAAIFLTVMKIAGGWPEIASIAIPVYITLFLATLAGMMQGLLVSALAPNQNVAPLLLVVIIVLQLVFGGIIPNRERGPIIDKTSVALSAATTTKWAFESLVTLSGMGKCVADDPCWNLSDDQRNQLSEEYKVENCTCMGPQIFKSCCFPGIQKYYDPALDEMEPNKPVRPIFPGDSPVQPTEPKRADYKSIREWNDAYQRYVDNLQGWDDNLESYNKKAKSYQDQIKKYEKDIDAYTKTYKEWQSNRSEAIGKAEGLISTMKQNYGQAFNVNIAQHWGILTAIILILFFILLAIQKLKDQL